VPPYLRQITHHKLSPNRTHFRRPNELIIAVAKKRFDIKGGRETPIAHIVPKDQSAAQV
jgi:hypothetical protein